MAFYYDGINLSELSELYATGVVSGVTTNLTLINGEKKNKGATRKSILEPLMAFCEQHNLPISVQVEANVPTAIIEEAKSLTTEYSSTNKLLVKVPVNFANLCAISKCSDLGFDINATCITSFTQAKLATLSGARIVSFFWGKMSDQGIDPYKHVKNYDTWRRKEGLENKTKILVGSVRQPASIESAFFAGADVVTTSKSNIVKLANQLMADEANRLFQETNL